MSGCPSIDIVIMSIALNMINKITKGNKGQLTQQTTPPGC